jgi:hypothetical protein
MNSADPIEVIRKAVEDGYQQEPNWGDPEPCGLSWLQEAVAHPEEPPILRMFQLDNDCEILGEIWLRPADIPELIRDLQIILEDYALRPPDRRWFGRPDGPRLNLMGADYYKAPSGDDQGEATSSGG